MADSNEAADSLREILRGAPEHAVHPALKEALIMIGSLFDRRGDRIVLLETQMENLWLEHNATMSGTGPPCRHLTLLKLSFWTGLFARIVVPIAVGVSVGMLVGYLKFRK